MFIKKYFRNKETIDNYIWRSLQILGKQGITFLIFFMCAKMLTVYDFGIYNYILTFVLLLIIFSDFGVSITTSKYVVEYQTEGKNYSEVLFSAMIISIVVTIVLVLGLILLRNIILDDNSIYLLHLIPTIFLAPLTSIYDGVYRGLKKFKLLALISISVGIISIFVVYFFISIFGLLGALYAQNVFYIILFIILFLFNNNLNCKLDFDIMKRIVGYSLLVGLVNIGYFLYIRADIIMLGQYGLIEDISYYEIINKVFMLLILPITLLGTVVAPSNTKLFFQKKYKKIKSNLLKENLWLFLTGSFISIITYFILIYVFELFLPEYNQDVLKFVLVLFLIMIPLKYVVNYIEQGYIIPGGYVKFLSINTIGFGVLNVLLNFILLPIYGFNGVLYATFMSLMLLNIGNIIYTYVLFKNRN